MIKTFSKFLKPYRWQFALAVLCIMLECGLEVVLPFLMNAMTKNGIEENGLGGYTMNLNYVLIIGSIMIGIAVLAFFLGVVGSKFSAIACRGLGYEIRKEEYQKLQKYSFSNVDSFRQSSLITRLTTDVQIISDTLCVSLRPALRAPLVMIFSLTFSLIISPLLSLIFVVSILVLGIMMFTIIKLVKPRFKLIQKLVDNINRVTQESIIAIKTLYNYYKDKDVLKTIKAYVKKDYELIKFQAANQELKNTATKALSINALSMPAGQIANYSTMIAIIYFGGLMAMSVDAAIVVEDIQTFLTYVLQLLATVMMFSNVLMAINRASASLFRVKEVLETDSEIINKEDSSLKITSGSIEFKNVDFKYESTSDEFVLKDINFNIKSGEFVGIVGQTGSSKSTLVYLMERYYEASNGQILLSANDIKEYSLKEVRDAISISFQSPTLFKGTVLENLKWGNKNATKDEIIEACKVADCYDFIENKLSDGFNTTISQGGTSVSGGQRQRLCIARALIKKPKILILDDSFSALDKITEARVKNNLKSILPDMTKIVISQKISTIQDADKIIVLDNGKISNIGTHDELIKIDPIYRDMYNLQVLGGEKDE